MNKAQEAKKIYLDGYARLGMFAQDPRLSGVLRLSEKLVPKYPKRVLDLGCGEGSFALALGEILKAEEIFGIDISPKAAKEAIGKSIKAQVLDIDEADLPFPSDYFDFIFCGNLIEDVLDPDHLLAQVQRVLARKGYLIMTFPNLCAWLNRLAVLLGFHPYYDRVSRKYEVGKLFIPVSRRDSTGLVHLYTLRSFRQLAGIYGLKALKFEGSREKAVPANLGFLDFLFAKIPSLAFRIICVATKE